MMLHAIELTIPRGEKEAIAAVAPWPERFAAGGFAEEYATDAAGDPAS